ncbi:hypothetical protein PS15p_208685 [Mucor circinelloides]
MRNHESFRHTIEKKGVVKNTYYCNSFYTLARQDGTVSANKLDCNSNWIEKSAIFNNWLKRRKKSTLKSQHKKGVTTQAHEPETHVGALSATIADPKPKERPLSRRLVKGLSSLALFMRRNLTLFTGYTIVLRIVHLPE